MNSNRAPFFILICSCLLMACSENNVLEQTIRLNYPSASGVENAGSKTYIIGDDANNLLILSDSLKIIDSIKLYQHAARRIPKKIKADLEAITLLLNGKLLLLGSGSSDSTRNVAWIIDTLTKIKSLIRLDSFYRRIKLSGIEQVNIEGVATYGNQLLLSNRGNKSYPKNHILITSTAILSNQTSSTIHKILLGSSADSNIFNGVSGLTYSSRSDRLICSISTEDTRSTLDDGAIGKSYLWIVDNFSSKTKWKAINPDHIIDLQSLNAAFKGQKIESVSVMKETRNFITLVLVADNDDGQSVVFTIIVEKD